MFFSRFTQIRDIFQKQSTKSAQKEKKFVIFYDYSEIKSINFYI